MSSCENKLGLDITNKITRTCNDFKILSKLRNDFKHRVVVKQTSLSILLLDSASKNTRASSDFQILSKLINAFEHRVAVKQTWLPVLFLDRTRKKTRTWNDLNVMFQRLLMFRDIPNAIITVYAR